MSSLFDKILEARGLESDLRDDFLSPNYLKLYDPFLLKDMDKAVERIVLAWQSQESIVVYGDYDIDGLTATTLLLDALNSFGFKNVDKFIPNRFTEGYGLSMNAIESIASREGGVSLIITVDCGSLSEKEIMRANELGIDVVVTDHHNAAKMRPPAVAVVNPKQKDDNYPFLDLAGVGVAFKLVQALQTALDGLPVGQEKWLLDLVALGTVCDVVPLLDENRILVFYGLKVLSNTRRIGLKGLMDVADIDIDQINTRSLGFGLGPRMNASGRLETAMHSLELLLATNYQEAADIAKYLDEMNLRRRAEQSKIVKEAIIKAESYLNDPVLVLSDADWNHGVVGIAAAKLLEKYKKPVFVLQELGGVAKGSARSYGDFSAVEVVEFCKDIITKGGGHKLAAGVTLPVANIDNFRKRANALYKDKNLINQAELLLPKADVEGELSELDFSLIDLISQLEPFGNGNLQPIIKTSNLLVHSLRRMGSDGQHVKLEAGDGFSNKMQFLAFNAPESFFVEPGNYIDVWYQPDVNEWGSRRSLECKILHLENSVFL